MKKPIKILLTSAGSRTVEAIIDCLGKIRDQVELIGTNSIAEFASLNEFDSAYLVPLTSDMDLYRKRLLKIILTEKPDVIMNGRDEEVKILSEISEETNTLFLGPPTAISNIFTDKYMTYHFSRKNDLPFTDTAYTEEELKVLIHKHGFPLVAKPRIGGHASKDVYIICNLEQATNLHKTNNIVFQPFLGGRKLIEKVSQWNSNKAIPWNWNPTNIYFMIDFVLANNGKSLALIITKAERSGSIVKKLEHFHDKTLFEMAQNHIEILGSNGHCGPVNIQGYIDDDGNFSAFEWNSRFVGSVYGYSLLGKNLVLEALKYYFPEIVNTPPIKTQFGQLFRPMVYKEVPENYIRLLRENGYWKRSS